MYNLKHEFLFENRMLVQFLKIRLLGEGEITVFK